MTGLISFQRVSLTFYREYKPCQHNNTAIFLPIYKSRSNPKQCTALVFILITISLFVDFFIKLMPLANSFKSRSKLFGKCLLRGTLFKWMY